MTITTNPEEVSPSNKSIFKRILSYFSKSGKLEETVKEIIEDSHPDRKKMGKSEQKILHNFLQFGDKSIDDIMVPRSEICAIQMNATLDEIMKMISTRSHTRFPIYKNDIDHICGFINIKDIIQNLYNKSELSLSKKMRKILTIVPNMRAIDVLTEMQAKQVHIAIVIDEYGATDGMVTIEDVIEELVGEIEDEHDVKNTKQEYSRLDKESIICSGKMELSKINKLFKIKLTAPEGKNIETIAGIILTKTGTVPKNGDIIQIMPNLQSEIIEATPRFIKQIKLTLIT